MQSFREQIIAHLTGMGYRKLNSKGDNVYGRPDGDAIYVVVLETCDGWRPETLKAFDRQAAEQIMAAGAGTVRLLNLLLIPDAFLDENQDAIITEMDNVWLFSEDFGKLYIYENQPPDFDDLRAVLDNEIQMKVRDRRLEFLKAFGVATPILILLNVLIYAATLLTKDDDRNSYLMFYMTELVPYMTEHKEYYRVITAMFYHFSFLHLACNMIVLFSLGGCIERSIGKFWYVVSYFVCGCASSVCSLTYFYLRNEIVCSGGASGAICGLMGMLIALLKFRRKTLPGVSLGRVIYLAGLTVLNGLIMTGTSVASVDNAAHIGGLAAGFLVGAVCAFVQTVAEKRKEKRLSG